MTKSRLNQFDKIAVKKKIDLVFELTSKFVQYLRILVYYLTCISNHSLWKLYVNSRGSHSDVPCEILLNTAHRTPVNCERCRSDRAATRETGCSRGPPDKTLWWNGKSVRNDFADSFALFSNHWGMARFTGLESPAQKRVLWTRTNTLREGEKGLSADSVLFWSQSSRLNQTSFSRDSVKITSQRSRWCRMTSFRWTGKVLKRLIWNRFYSSSWCWKVCYFL